MMFATTSSFLPHFYLLFAVFTEPHHFVVTKEGKIHKYSLKDTVLVERHHKDVLTRHCQQSWYIPRRHLVSPAPLPSPTCQAH